MADVVVSGPAKNTLIELAATDRYRYQQVAALLIALGKDPLMIGSRPIHHPDDPLEGERVLRSGHWEVLYRVDGGLTRVEVALIRRM